MSGFWLAIVGMAIISGLLPGVWLHSAYRHLRLTRGTVFAASAPVVCAAGFALPYLARMGDGPFTAIVLALTLIVSGGLLTAGLFLLLRGSKPVHLK